MKKVPGDGYVSRITPNTIHKCFLMTHCDIDRNLDNSTLNH